MLCIADSLGNICFFQKDQWDSVSGIINFEYTLPKFWHLFNYTEQELEEIDFVLKFIENEEKIDVDKMAKSTLSSAIELLAKK